MVIERGHLTVSLPSESVWEHGGNVYRLAEELKMPLSEVVDFSASLNPLGVPQAARKEIRRLAGGLVHYPDPEAAALRRQLARFLGIPEDSILCGNGSTELIYLVVRALKPHTALIPAPTFSEYERACTLGEVRVQHLVLKREEGFALDPAQFIERMEGCDMAFLCNPENPTGRLLDREAVIAMARAARRFRCFLVVDEAFVEFCPGGSVLHAVGGNPYLVVLRSMTKFYALAGLRIGYGVFPLEVAAQVRRHKEPWTVNTLAQAAGAAALGDDAYRLRTRRLMAREKRRLEKGFQACGVEFLPSAANYYLIRPRDALGLSAHLRTKGVLVRECANFRGLDGSYLRVAVKSRTDSARFLKELATWQKG